MVKVCSSMMEVIEWREHYPNCEIKSAVCNDAITGQKVVNYVIITK